MAPASKRKIMAIPPKGKKLLAVYIDEELYKKLWEYIESSYQENIHELLKIEVQNAITHWLNEKKRFKNNK
jgi:hypothetical protein